MQPPPSPFPVSLQTCDQRITRSAGLCQLNFTPDFPKSFRLTQCKRRPAALPTLRSHMSRRSDLTRAIMLKAEISSFTTHVGGSWQNVVGSKQAKRWNMFERVQRGVTAAELRAVNGDSSFQHIRTPEDKNSMNVPHGRRGGGAELHPG